MVVDIYAALSVYCIICSVNLITISPGLTIRVQTTMLYEVLPGLDEQWFHTQPRNEGAHLFICWAR